MNGEERQKLRSDLLQGLHDVYFNENGTAKPYNKGDLNKDIEKKLAYEYLVQKGFAKQVLPLGGQKIAYIITASGIDVIEAKEKKRETLV